VPAENPAVAEKPQEPAPVLPRPVAPVKKQDAATDGKSSAKDGAS
jgi:hypothetical protein